jgi:hypothetical protein
MFLFAPNGDFDNHTYSGIVILAQEKLNYVATEYSNKDEQTDVESTQRKTMLLLTNSPAHAQRAFRINAPRRCCRIPIIRRTVACFRSGSRQSRNGRITRTPIVYRRDAALSTIHFTEKDGGCEDVMRGQDRLYASNASQPAAMSFNAAP